MARSPSVLAETAEGRRRVRAGCRDRAVDRHEGGREGRGAHRRRGQKGRHGGHRQQAGLARRQLLRADGADRCDDRHLHHQGGDLRPGSVAPLYRFKSDAEGVEMAKDPKGSEALGAGDVLLVSAVPAAMWSAGPRREPSTVRRGSAGTFSNIRGWPARSLRRRSPGAPEPRAGGRQTPMWQSC